MLRRVWTKMTLLWMVEVSVAVSLEHSFCEHPARGHKRNCSRLKACHCAPALGWRSSLFSSRSRATSWRRRESSRRPSPSSPSSPPSLPALKIGGNESAGHQPACVGPTEIPRIRMRQPCWARRTVGALLCRGSLRNTSTSTCLSVSVTALTCLTNARKPRQEGRDRALRDPNEC